MLYIASLLLLVLHTLALVEFAGAVLLQVAVFVLIGDLRTTLKNSLQLLRLKFPRISLI